MCVCIINIFTYKMKSLALILSEVIRQSYNFFKVLHF